MKENSLTKTRTSRMTRVIRPIQEFIRLESSSGILLLLSTIVALGWTNSPWSRSYFSFWHTEVLIGLGNFTLAKPLLHWINDGLMVIFFFVVGLEIKREILVGELSSPRQSMLPIAGALGGMIVPAAMYALLNMEGEGSAGWGIPMATDIAFAIGVLTLLGKRVPLGLKVFLTALAIVDDLGAVLVIALFYTSGLSVTYLVLAAGLLLLLVAANLLDVRRPLAYAALGVGLWFVFLKSGVHATVAGVVLAMAIPGRARIDKRSFVDHGKRLLKEISSAQVPPRAGQAKEQRSYLDNRDQGIVQTIEESCKEVQTPMQRFEHALHPWVTFGIIPLFALANAGVALSDNLATTFANPIALGVIAGLVVGKQTGITLFTLLAVKLRLAVLPSGVSMKGIYGVGWLGGIGFTMSLFIAALAFGESALLDVAKASILSASLIAGVGGWILLNTILPRKIISTTNEEKEG